MTVDAFLCLGGNLGDRKQLMDDAVARLDALPTTSVAARSSYYRTAPVGPVKQEWFLNIAVKLRTGLRRAELLDALLEIETALGRDRSKEIYFGPRTMDIDLLGYDGILSVEERAFVLVPLAEIAAALIVDGRRLSDVVAGVGSEGVEKLDWPVPA